MEVTEQNIIKLLKKGKREGYDLLYKKYKNYIYSICYHYTNSNDDALDLIQEVFIKLFKSANAFEDGKPLMPWIKRISINTCLNYLRDKKKDHMSLNIKVDDSDSEFEALLPSEANTENEVVSMDTKRVLQELIRRLPGEERIAIILRHIKNMSYDDIAKYMSCPLGTVKTHIYRGRKELKEMLKKEGIWEV